MAMKIVRNRPWRGSGGFSLIEALAVLVLLGILAAVVAGVARGSGAGVVRAEAAELAMHLRYARARALADTESWRLEISGGSGWQIRRTGGDVVRLPGETESQYSLSEGMSLRTNTGTDLMVFTSWGQPADRTGTPLSVDSTWTVGNGDYTATVTIHAGTGLVEN